MTLNMTLLNWYGAWQCADHRLLRRDLRTIDEDSSAKQISIWGTDGHALIAYAGVGKIRSRFGEVVMVSDWIRELLRGPDRPIFSSLLLLRNVASKDLAPTLKVHKEPLVFSVAASIGGQPWAIELRNTKHSYLISSKDATLDAFQGTAHAIPAGMGGWLVTGIRESVGQADLETLQQVCHKKPRNPHEFSSLLMAINKRTAAVDRRISTHCTVRFTAPDGEGDHTIIHGSQDNPNNCLSVPSVLHGIDGTDTNRAMLEWARAAKRRSAASLSSFMKSRFSQTASQEPVTPRNRLR